jgi:hypothetical protein
MSLMCAAWVGSRAFAADEPAGREAMLSDVV